MFQFNLLYLYSPLPPTTPTLPGGTTTHKRKAPPPPKSPRQVSQLIHSAMITIFKVVLLDINHNCMCLGMQQGTQSSPDLHHGTTQCSVPDNSTSPSPAPKTQHSFPDKLVSLCC